MTAPVLRRARAGWWHDYVCPTHGTELLPPPVGSTDAADAAPTVFPCPYGCRCSGERVAAAWTVLENQAAARRARLLARQAAADPARRPDAVALVRDAADCYREVAAGWSEASEDWMLRGKLFAQALTEAIWAVQVADAVETLAAAPDGHDLGDDVVGLLGSLLETVTAARRVLVDDRGDRRHNYTAWLDAAGAGLSRAIRAVGAPAEAVPSSVRAAELDPATWVARLVEHVALAVGDDGWEWEGATYYHVFVLRAYLLTLRGTRPGDLPGATAQRLAAMVRALGGIAAPDGSLPVLHDGPYDRTGMHLEVLEVCVLARGLWQRTGLEQVEAYARRRLGPAHDGLEDLLHGWFDGPPRAGIDVPRGSVLFDRAGYAVLRDAADTWQAVLDAGPHGGPHGHLDKLALYLHGDGVAWQPAPAVPPYGSALRRDHYARSVAHPTLRVGEADQQEASAEILVWEPADDGGRVVARTADAIPGVRFTREVRMAAGHLVDVVRAASVDGAELPFGLALRPAVPLEVRVDGERWRTRWAGGRGGPDLHGVHVASVPARLVAVPGRGPSSDPGAPVTVAEWEARAAEVVLVSVYSPDGAPSDVRLVRTDDEVTAVRVRLADGTTHEHEVSR